MVSLVVAYLLGTITLLWLPELSLVALAASLSLLLLAYFRPSCRWLLVAYYLGFGLALWQSNAVLEQHQSPLLDGQDRLVELRIVELPETTQQKTRFVAELISAQQTAAARLPKRVRLSWYRDAPPLHVGDHWQLLLRLKPPHGFANPGGFDLERWLFSQRISAVGYVRSSSENQRLSQRWSINRWREQALTALSSRLTDSDAATLIPALAFGVRDSMTHDTWQRLRATGTSHLLAISGLHIGLVAGMAYALANFIWRRVGFLCARYPAQKAAAIVSVIPALLYAALAGFSVPTQRALVMLLVVVAVLLSERRISRSHTLAIALAVVLLWDPLAVLSAGFWLSFSAVAILLLLAAQGAVHPWLQLLRMQLWLVIAMMPLTLWWFSEASLVAPVANLLAVPWVSLWVMPLLFVTLLLLPWPVLSQPLLQLLEWSLEQLLVFLGVLAELPFAAFSLPGTQQWLFLAALIGVTLLLALRGFPGRELAFLWCLPLCLARIEPPPAGGFEVAFLDVGQGLSVVVLTQNHVLVYDTGDRYSSGFSVAGSVVLPFLAYRDRAVIDALVLSHADRDHAGGAAVVRQALTVRKTLASYSPKRPMDNWQRCVAGQEWRWDGVTFRVLHPSAGFKGSKNDRSCVLVVESGDTRVLLTGDIGRAAERELLSTQAAGLNAQVMSVPHHGSLTSSSEAFLDAVKPQLAVASLGYRNRFGFPKKAISDRYQQQGSQMLRSDESGAVIASYTPRHGWSWLGYRQNGPRLWHAGTPESLGAFRLLRRFTGFHDGSHIDEAATEPAQRQR